MAVADVIDATEEHAEYIADRARMADVQELWAFARVTPLECMKQGMDRCKARTGTIDGQPVCMFGVTPVTLLGAAGTPWMVGTTELDKNQLTVARRCRPELSSLYTGYNVLVNFVDARNRKAIRWLKWLGFDLDQEPTPMGPDSMPFYRFHMRRI